MTGSAPLLLTPVNSSVCFLLDNSTNVQTTYLSALTTSSPTFNHSKSASSARNCYYKAVQVSVSISGVYSISSNSTIDTVGYLYNNTFNYQNPNQDILISGDDEGGNRQFMLAIILQPMKNYTLVVTTYQQNITGSFRLIAIGAGSTVFVDL
ncbi:unnamed protein product [Adineta ricciae]|uniref:Uncharacterized protein n=1 Tax=Adineta ricciae TaxID=249248 RepID=A0A815VMM2_ADIRI|nr:unnamed protein product [Adineta ricciae]CAF1663747.1 unnamed protein product [Adineta ricciae]